MVRQDSVTKFVIYGKLHTKLNLPLLSLGYFFNSQTFKQFYIAALLLFLECMHQWLQFVSIESGLGKDNPVGCPTGTCSVRLSLSELVPFQSAFRASYLKRNHWFILVPLFLSCSVSLTENKCSRTRELLGMAGVLLLVTCQAGRESEKQPR
jgi:hypothetical protein